VRSADFGKNDKTYFTRTHLGNLLQPGDIALGYDVTSANIVDPVRPNAFVRNVAEVERPLPSYQPPMRPGESTPLHHVDESTPTAPHCL
jgi:hypothetical protein